MIYDLGVDSVSTESFSLHRAGNKKKQRETTSGKTHSAWRHMFMKMTRIYDQQKLHFDTVFELEVSYSLAYFSECEFTLNLRFYPARKNETD